MERAKTVKSLPKNTIIIYASETGQTKKIARSIEAKFLAAGLSFTADPIDIAEAKLQKLMHNDFFIFGCPTWNIGELQADLEAALPAFEAVDFSGKVFAVFGLGDSQGYPDTYQDAMAILAEKVQSRGGRLIGKTSAEGYRFKASLAVENGKFLGLALDEDNEAALSESRISGWVEQIMQELSRYLK